MSDKQLLCQMRVRGLSGSAHRHAITDPAPIGSGLSYNTDLSRAARPMPLVTEGYAALLTEAAIRFAIAHPAIESR